jgi:DNA replication protein DnaC
LPDSKLNTTLDNCYLLPVSLVEWGKTWAMTYPIKSLYLWGTYGSGKTTFAFAIIREILLHQGKKLNLHPVYYTAKKLDSKLLSAIRDYGGDTFELQKLSEYGLLFIDDFDKINTTERLKSQIFEVINNRYENKIPTIITSNLPPTDLGKLIDNSIQSRIGDEIHWERIEFPEKDLRTMKSRKF